MTSRPSPKRETRFGLCYSFLWSHNNARRVFLAKSQSSGYKSPLFPPSHPHFSLTAIFSTSAHYSSLITYHGDSNPVPPAIPPLVDKGFLEWD